MIKFTSMLGTALLAATLSSPAAAVDTVLQFTGTCENALCTGAGADGTTPATVTARITLTDLEWVATDGVYGATFTDAKDFAYTGPRYFAHADTSDVVPDNVAFFSTAASVDSIVEFDLRYAGGSAYFAGDATGWGLGTFLSVGGVSLPMNFETGSVAGQWTVSAVPEPESAALLLAGLGLLGWRTRRRSQRQPAVQPAA